MKRILLSMAVAVISTAGVNAQTRLVLYEEFTGENCPSCASTNPTLDAMMATAPNTTKIHMIKYMCDIPSGGSFYNMTNSIFETTRQNYYTVPFAPFGTIDGFIPDGTSSYPGYPAYLTQADLDAGAAVASPFRITATYKYNSTYDSVTITAHVKAIAAYAPASGSIKLRSALCKSLHFATSPGSNGETDFENTVRGMYPDAAGLSVTGTWAVGDSQTYVVKGAVISETSSAIPHTASDTSVVVWIQNDHDKVVAQTAVATRTGATGIADHNKVISGYTAFPNPASDKVTLSFTAARAATATVSVYSATGNLAYKVTGRTVKEGSNEVSFSTTDIPAGIYCVKLQMEEATESTVLTIVK